MNAVYARQSIDKRDSLSIEGQIELCRKFAGADAKIYSDKGFSGKNTKRPAFNELLNDVEAGKIQKIFVYRLDRFSRSIADFSSLWELLQSYKVEFNSVTEQFDTSSPMGRAMLNIVLVFAQLERETTAERVKDNYVHRFKLGAWMGGPAPYGFELAKMKDGDRTVSTLVENKKQSEVVKWIFSEYAKPDGTLRSIAKELTQKGIHGPKREAFDNVTLSRFLHSPLYVKANEDVYFYYLSKGLQTPQSAQAFDGVHACNIICRRDHSKNKYNDLNDQLLSVSNHNGFIEPDLWLTVQEKLEKNKQIPKRNAGKYSFLTGLMKCAKCGYSLKINYAKNEDKYCLLCSGRSNLGVCNCTVSVNLKELEAYIETEIDKMLKSAPPVEVIPEESRLANQVLEVEKKIERLVSALAESSEISAKYISAQIEKLDKERNRLLEIANRQPKANRPKTIDFKKLTFEEKKIVAAEFIEKIKIEGNNVEIVWKV